MSKSRRWCFTVNNYTSDHEQSLSGCECNYMVYGREVSTSGTPHLQGFIVLKSPQRLSYLQRLLSGAHWEVACGNDQQAADYCKKDGDFIERGVLTKQGERTDLKVIYRAIAEGSNETSIAETYPNEYSRYFKAFNRYRQLKDNEKKKKIKEHKLYDWQSALIEEFKGEADERTILFVIDYEGNKGKSWFALYCLNNLPNVQIIDPGKKADMAYELKQDVKVLFIDCARSRVDVLDYHFMEKVKDGVVFSPKYESTVKFLANNVHVVVLLNEDPDPYKLSADRYRYLNI